MDYKKGEKIIEGKTKIIWACEDNPKLVIVESKNDITAYDNPDLTKKFKTKAVHSTTVTCQVFALLKRAGIPVAYESQISATEFLAPDCKMIPLEVVARRYAVGSFLKRHPELSIKNNEDPHRFHNLVTEFFLKTTRGSLTTENGERILEGLDPQAGEEDPFIVNPYEEYWKLHHAKKPAWDVDVSLNKEIEASKILSGNFIAKMKEMDEILRKVFLVLEGVWNTLGLRIIDMKIEFGIDKEGKLMVADVIDNDSWRLKDALWEELSKEAFRQGEELDEVERKYGLVASLTKKFRIPKQALVLWRGSDSDPLPELGLFKNTTGVVIENVVLSGHKSTRQCLDALEKILGKYPDGGVILAKAGRSNGLGPIVAARTSWPVIAVPATIDSFPEDIWSSIRMPSKVPLATAWPESNAMLLAAEILAQKNPVLHQKRQMMIEKLDE